MNGAEALVKTLVSHGTTCVYQVPGETFVSVLDQLADCKTIQTITTQHENAAAFAAGAYAEVMAHMGKPKPGVFFTTRAPGATNVFNYLQTAMEYSIPVIHFAAHVTSDKLNDPDVWQQVPESFQAFKDVTKKVLIVSPESNKNIAEITAEAFQTALSGRPGPVTVVLPSDMLTKELGDISIPEFTAPKDPVPEPDQVRKAIDVLKKAKKPVIIAGELACSKGLGAEIQGLANVSGAVVLNTWHQPHYLVNHPHFAGNLCYAPPEHVMDTLKEADVLIYAGQRLDELATGGFHDALKNKTIIHIHPEAGKSHRTYNADVRIEGSLEETLKQMLMESYPISSEKRNWADMRAAKAMDFITGPHKYKGDVNVAEVIRNISGTMPDDGIITSGAAAFVTFLSAVKYPEKQQVLGSFGTMGGGVPQGIGAQGANADKTVVVVTGDGNFMMGEMPELRTLREHNLPVKVVVLDNGLHGAIFGHQVRGQRDGTLHNEPGFGTRREFRPDFRKVADGLGVKPMGRKPATDNNEFARQFAQALEEDGPALVHVVYDGRNLAAGKTL